MCVRVAGVGRGPPHVYVHRMYEHRAAHTRGTYTCTRNVHMHMYMCMHTRKRWGLGAYCAVSKGGDTGLTWLLTFLQTHLSICSAAQEAAYASVTLG